MESESSHRRSERKRKRKESYSPEGKKEGCKKNKDGPKQSRPKSSSRLYDVLPNGEPFSCHLCKSPYVVNQISKGVKKSGRSRHTPLPKVRIDANTGKEMMLCNACVQIFDRPQRRVVKAASIPTEEDKSKYQENVNNFIKFLKSQFEEPLVERLFCPVSQRKLCGCLQRYIESNGVSEVPLFVSWMKQAIELRKEKSYPITDDNKRVKLIGLGNGHKKSKSYEEFVLKNRRVLKEDLRLCERATQKILMYSNNFLHKRLKTENRPCRVERTRGKAALGQLPDIHTMVDMYCCSDNCVMMALTHKRLLQSWRDRSQQGQQEARRVMAEMLTPAGATHLNCYTFISMVTGCSQQTISSVSNQMLDTGGVREPPEHGMKRVWQEHYKQTRTSEGTNTAKASLSTADNLTQEVTSSQGLANPNTVINLENAFHHHKLAWIQDLANKQLQQQQIALQLQDIIAGGKQRSVQSSLGSAQDTPVIRLGETNTALLKPGHVSVNQLQQINPVQGQINNGQGQTNIVQGQTNIVQGQTIISQGQANIGQVSLSQGQINVGQINGSPCNVNQCQGQINIGQINISQDQSQQGHDKRGQDQVNLSYGPITLDQGQLLGGQGQVTIGQGHLPQFILQPPPQYGAQHEVSAKPWNPVSTPFPLNVNNMSFLVSRDQQQVMPVLFLPKQNQDQHLLSGTKTVIETPSQSIGPCQSPVQVADNLKTVRPVTENLSSGGTQNQIYDGNQTEAISVYPLKFPQTQKKSQVVKDQANPVVNFQNVVPKTVLLSSSEQDPKQSATIRCDKLNSSDNINPNMYFQIVHESSQKTDKNQSIKLSSQLPKQNENMEAMRQTLSVSDCAEQLAGMQEPGIPQALPTQLKHKCDINNIKGGQTGNNIPDPSLQQTIEGRLTSDKNVNNVTITAGPTKENNSDIVATNYLNQEDLATQPVNQTQLILPVNILPANEGGSLQVPSQIQISFQTCSPENNQQTVTQQLILPHGEIITLPMMPVPISNTSVVEGTQTIESSSGLQTSVVSCLGAESSSTESSFTAKSSNQQLSEADLHLHFLNQKDMTFSNQIKPQKSAVKSRNSSGSSKKSRNSSGASESNTRKSVVQFSDTVQSDLIEQNSISTASLEQLSETHFISKINKNRHRHASGNSEHGDRSRKSSGNSLISDTSSLVSGLTLSNLASPNIFHDKDKGIFFIQSIDGLELNEIDSNHIVDFIQAVEADQSGSLEVQSTNPNQSMKNVTNSDIEFVNQSGLVESGQSTQSNGRTIRNDKTYTNPKEIEYSCQIGAGSKEYLVENKRMERLNANSLSSEDVTAAFSSEYTGAGIVQIQTQNIPNMDKMATRKNTENQSKTNSLEDKVVKNENQSINMATKMAKPKIDGTVSLSSFKPIAPKVSSNLWNVATSAAYSNNLVAQNAPVLSSLLSKKPITGLPIKKHAFLQ